MSNSMVVASSQSNVLRSFVDWVRGVFASLFGTSKRSTVQENPNMGLGIVRPDLAGPASLSMSALASGAGYKGVLPPQVGHPLIPRNRSGGRVGQLLDNPMFTQALITVPSEYGPVDIDEDTFRWVIAAQNAPPLTMCVVPATASFEAIQFAQALLDVLNDDDMRSEVLARAKRGDKQASVVAEGVLVVQCVRMKMQCEALASRVLAGDMQARQDAYDLFMLAKNEPYKLDNLLSARMLNDALCMGAAAAYSPVCEDQGYDSPYDPCDLRPITTEAV